MIAVSRKRGVSLALALVLAVACVPAPAWGWSNGWGGDGYGTHDWVLDEALRLAGDDGAWVDRDTALLATDDPDYVFRDFENHVYRPSTMGKGAAWAVQENHLALVAAYRAGDLREASYRLGLLSHYVSDVAQPYHTSDKVYGDGADAETARHLAYESDVDGLTGYPGENREWVSPRVRRDVTSTVRLTADVAAASRRRYLTLDAAYSAGGWGPTAEAITRECLSSAANALADVIRSVAAGVPPEPLGTLSVVAPRPTARPAATVFFEGHYRDGQGRPQEGVPVTLNWESGGTSGERVLHTDAAGRVLLGFASGDTGPGDTVLCVGTVSRRDGSVSSSAAMAVSEADTPPEMLEAYGKDRYATAVAASRDGFPGGADAVVVVTGTDWPDALGGSALAGAYGGPVLLAGPRGLDSGTLGEVRRLAPDRAFVLGGTAAVPASVEAALRDAGVAVVTRISGQDRYRTSYAVARHLRDALPVPPQTALVATGVSFPDALAASPLSAAMAYPIYLHDPAAPPEALASEMAGNGIETAVLLGGETALPSSVEAAIGRRLLRTVRLAGGDRYATARAVADWSGYNSHLSWNGVCVATGEGWPDALSGGVLAAREGAVMVLTRTGSLPDPTREFLLYRRPATGRVRVLGGPAAVSEAVRHAVLKAVD